VSYKGRKVEDADFISIEPPYLFRSYDHHANVPKADEKRNALELNPGYSQRIPIWQVARATSAAPTYFDPITIEDRKYGDGGFGSNNPIHLMYNEVCQMNGNNKSSVGLLLSIGTGQSPPLSRFGTGIFKKFYTFLKAAKQLATEAEGDHENMLRELKNDERAPSYFRFNVPWQSTERWSPVGSRISTGLDSRRIAANHGNTERGNGKVRKIKPLGEMALDEWKPASRLFRRKCNTTLRDIRRSTEAYLSDPNTQKDLETVATLLVKNRRLRSQTQHWDLYSRGTQFRCMHQNCHSMKAQKMRPHSNSLKQHLKKYHNVTKEEELEEFVQRGRMPY